jgi:hypothetical protein
MPWKKSHPADHFEQFIPFPIDDNLLAGLAILWRAYTYAQDADADVWDFALRIDRLHNAGLSISDLHWLVAKGTAKHGQETSVYGDPHRSFSRGDGFYFENTTCLVLTRKGAAFASRVLKKAAQTKSIETDETATPSNHSTSTNGGNGSHASAKPHWDPVRRELSVSEKIMKRFRVPAPNQELILAAFQEEGWPDTIDDPLPHSGDTAPQTRLHAAINRLNGKQLDPSLRFHGNGSGNGVCWRLAGQR